MYAIRYWDAFGEAHQTEPMDKETATVFMKSMNAEQEAMLVFINK